MNYAIAVLDIGKTNKKVAIYDDAMKPLVARKRKIETIRLRNYDDAGDIDVEDIDGIENWFLEELKKLATRYPIRVISISTHGASLVCVDAEGRPSVPPLPYTHEVPSDVHERFWAAMGNPHEIQTSTATAEIKPLVNAAKLLWYQKERWPTEFERTQYILFFPQYFGYRLTGKVGADITYVGAHSYLWDFANHDWSSVVDELRVRRMLPKVPRTPESGLGELKADVAAATGLSPDTQVTLGIHDSNSSLIPYLISQERDFVLNSTGTWCVAMHPVAEVAFSPDELGKMVFYNLSYRGTPVKTSILLGGLEYSVYTEALMKHHRREDWPEYNPAVYEQILADSQVFILPGVIPGTGQFPNSVARVVEGNRVYLVDDLNQENNWPHAFDDYSVGFALANLSLAIQSSIALKRVGLESGTELYIEGGFRQNSNYRALLSALLPENPIFLTALVEASIFGAALCGKALMDAVSVESLKNYVALDKIAVKPLRLDGLQCYTRIFTALLLKEGEHNIEGEAH